MGIEKTISFILDTQAKTEVILQAAAERQNQAEARMTRFDRRMRFYIRAGVRQMSEIRATQARTDIALEKLTHRLDEVTDKLDALIVVVDGVVRRPNSSPGAA